MSLIQTFTGTLTVMTCGKCGVIFGMETEMHDRKVQEHGSFFCPNGCNRRFIMTTKVELLQQELAQKNDNIDYLRRANNSLHNQVATLNYSVRAQKAAKTKIINRVKNGVCPCCNRTFQNLQNHFKTKHPELITGT